MMPRRSLVKLNRLAGVALSAVVSLAAVAVPASADVEYPWCMMQGRNSPQSCTYMTVEQCRASLAANAGFCERNPRYVATQRTKLRR
jgi:hypothetical protein